MIDSMEYLALGAGLTFGLVYLHLSQAIDWILVVIHYAFFRSKESFYGLYDNTEQESVYEHPPGPFEVGHSPRKVCV